MKDWKVLILIITTVCLHTKVFCSLNTSAMTLGNNLLVNSLFTSPSVPKNKMSNSYPEIKDWKLLNKCELIYIPLICSTYSLFCQTTKTQAINLTATAVLKKQIKQKLTVKTTADYLIEV